MFNYNYTLASFKSDPDISNSHVIGMNELSIIEDGVLKSFGLVGCIAIAGVSANMAFMTHRPPADADWLVGDIDRLIKELATKNSIVREICIYRIDRFDCPWGYRLDGKEYKYSNPSQFFA